MSWVTLIWSMTAGICLTLGAVHFLVWTRRRVEWANLVFSLSAAAAAGYATLDLMALRAQTPAEYGELLQWMLLLGLLEGVLIAWFIRLYLKAGRLWLLWLISGLRALMVALNFVPGPNFYFREITGVHPMPLLGELISHAHGVLHPWAGLMQLSLLLILIFVIDATRSAVKRGAERRRWVLGGLTALGFSLVLVSYALYVLEILPSTFSSQLFLSIIVLMGYELSLDMLRAGQLSRDLLESQQRMRLAASAADLGLWEWNIVRDEIWATENSRKRAGVGASERITFDRFLQSVHPDDREPTQRAARDSLDGHDEFQAEYRMVSQDHLTRWIAARGHVERDPEGKPLRMRGVSVDITERKQAEAARLDFTRRLIASQENERKRIAAELHDSLGQELLLVKNRLAMAAARQADSAELMQQLDAATVATARAIAEVRAISHALRPAALDEVGLTKAIEWMAEQLGETSTTKFSTDLDNIDGLLAPEMEMTLFRILQEGLSNVVRHSGAAQLILEVKREETGVRASLFDNGRGFDLEKLPAQAGPGRGLGLLGMRERVSYLGGNLEIQSAPARGTRLTVQIPLKFKPTKS
jgi:two-component system, LuxR family, sensor kinase FixL